MAIDDIPRLLTTLFTAPTDAVTKAASEQRRIWMDWLKDVKRLVDDVGDGQDVLNKENYPGAPPVSACLEDGCTGVSRHHHARGVYQSY